ncbi:MAG: hypothetical protein AB2A00_21495 [Myxococcota bacterium]
MRTTSLLLCLGLLGLASACAYKVVHGGRLSPSAIERLLSDVERIRGLKATAPLRVSLEGRQRLRTRSEADLHRPSFLQSMEELSQAWMKIGLVPPNTDLAAAFTAVGSEAPAGYYDTSDRILRIIDRQNPRSEILELTGFVRRRDLMDGEVLAHEVAHALQDMHFDLNRFLSTAPNDDASVARRCLAEGDASFVGYAYSSVFTPSMEAWLKFLESRASALDVRGAPDFLNRRFQLPYISGARFVAKLHRKGGWKLVNAAYADPPASTEEILHPEKYLEGRDRPVDVRLPDLRKLLPEGSREIFQDSVGELGFKTVLARERPDDKAKEEPTVNDAALGWDGDRASVLVRNGELLLAWKLAFDDEKDAREGFEAYRMMAERYPAYAVIKREGERMEARTGPVGLWLERQGLVVVVLEGFPLDSQARIAEAVFHEPDGHAFDPPGTDGGGLEDGGVVDGGEADASVDAGVATDAGDGGVTP